MVSYKSNAVKGTFILMAAGLLTRLLGFYYRIFLSSRIGAEGMGLYQMIFPIYGLCMSLSVSGIATTISGFVSKNKENSLRSLLCGCAISIPLSVICTVILLFFGDAIALHYLHEPRCTLLLRTIALSLPFGTIHCCINGYFLGKREALIPGISQLTEQLVRVLGVFIIFDIFVGENCENMNITSLAMIAVGGLIIGEIASTILCSIAVYINQRKGERFTLHSKLSSLDSSLIKTMVNTAYPLTLSRVTLAIFHSLEASAIPFFLQKYGMSGNEALSIYGVLTGMAVPFVMFPTTFANSVAQMLLPTISAAEASHNTQRIQSIATKTLCLCALAGLCCTLFFIITGNYLGEAVFNNTDAGNFITILAWLCPLIFASSTMGSILNGLGMTKATFFHNVAGSCISLFFIIFAIPICGIRGYLWGILCGELLCAVLHTLTIFKYIRTSTKD